MVRDKLHCTASTTVEHYYIRADINLLYYCLFRNLLLLDTQAFRCSQACNSTLQDLYISDPQRSMYTYYSLALC